MNKEEFIKECSMRNLAQCFSQWYSNDCQENSTINDCYNAAKKLADLLYD